MLERLRSAYIGGEMETILAKRWAQTLEARMKMQHFANQRVSAMSLNHCWFGASKAALWYPKCNVFNTFDGFCLRHTFCFAWSKDFLFALNFVVI